ncbi:MAG TPA: DegV family protein [Erysipelotrichaceae bacterium]|nr:DegV family protein [Erysipelotrichaceae bacterium]
MKKIAVIADSSIAFNKEDMEKYEVYMVPNVIMHNDTTYFDQVTITNSEIEKLLDDGETLTTSQPAIGQIMELYKEVVAKDYDHIFVLSISKNLSGGYNAFNQAANQLELENISILDTQTITGVIQQAVKAIRKMNAEDKSIEEITEYLNKLFANQTSYLHPKSLKQIVASGRLHPAAGKIASMLKIQTLLYIKPGLESIEKLAVTRTNKKIFETIIEDMQKNNVDPKTHDIYIFESSNTHNADDFLAYLSENYGDFTINKVRIAASLSVHVGNGAYGVQTCLKI